MIFMILRRIGYIFSIPVNFATKWVMFLFEKVKLLLMLLDIVALTILLIVVAISWINKIQINISLCFW